ncbi:MAG: enolase C-terminal domain-like protein [Wenzhouxiangellaceae bacterium]|nr:enolase C-terminal domain-like protein [Wenzhouxiangellaceae bacterium]
MNPPLSPWRCVLRELHAHRLTLPLAEPLDTGRGRFANREVVLIELAVEFDGEIRTGWGEASPLAGWCGGRPKAIETEARRFGMPCEIDFSDLGPALGPLDPLPVLRHGVETALFDARARHAGQTLARTLIRTRAVLLAHPEAEPATSPVPVQCTIGAAAPEATRQAVRDAIEAGYGCVKLKVGAAAPEADLARCKMLATEFSGIRFRLDANGAWSLPEALEMLERLPTPAVELVEQPVAPPAFEALLEARAGRHGRPSPAIAADESCAGREQALGLIDDGRVDALVVKPCTLGGLVHACEVLAHARARGMDIIFSNLMESAVGRAAAAALAAAWPDFPGPHGLATGAWFGADVAPAPDRIEQGLLYPHRAEPGLGFTPVIART